MGKVIFKVVSRLRRRRLRVEHFDLLAGYSFGCKYVHTAYIPKKNSQDKNGNQTSEESLTQRIKTFHLFGLCMWQSVGFFSAVSHLCG
jgi:hypothetical protein